MPVIIPLVQGSQAWLDYRKSKIMATDSPVILGSNPWKTKLELWEEKLGFRPPVEMNDAMRRGQELEPEARKLASNLINVDFESVILESDKFPEFAASLDGFHESGCILEIKCPKEFTHLDAADGNLPLYYLDQIQHQLFVSGADICYYFSYRPEYKDQPYAIVEVFPDFGKHEQIIKLGYEFYRDLQTMNPPEEWKFKEKKL